MKKFLMYGSGAVVLQLINNEVLSWLALLAVAAVLLAKWFPIMMEGTK